MIGVVASIALGGAVGAGLVYLSPALLKPLAIRRLRTECVRRKMLVLTYDDGPGPETTGALLDLLATYDAKATFFMSGARIDEHEGVARRVATEGHEIASHAFDHLHAWKSAPWAAMRDVDRGVDVVAKLTTQGAVSFRPPFGKVTLPTWAAAKRRGAPLAWWTDDSGDSFAQLPGGDSPALALLERGGGVALMHDLDRSAPRNAFVLETTRALLAGAKERGLGVATMGELLAGR